MSSTAGHTAGLARLRRKLSQYEGCSPEEISVGSQAAIRFFIDDAKHDIGVLSRASTPSADMKTAKKIKGDVLVWWPIVEMDAEGNLTNVVKGGAWIVTQFVGNSWNEPDQINSIGEWFGDDDCYATEPTHWLPVPAKVSDEAARAAIAAAKGGAS